jgi:iron(III) transport system ATP-binding protein
MNFLAAEVKGSGCVALGAIMLSCDTDAFAPGAKIRLCMRPEDIRVRGVTRDTANAVEARIADIEFLGASGRATLAPSATPTTEFVADFSVNLMSDLGLEAGKTIWLALPADRLRVFPER